MRLNSSGYSDLNKATSKWISFLKMKIIILHICIFANLLLFSSDAYTQNHWIDSLKKAIAIQKPDTNEVYTLLNLSDTYRFSYPDSALAYAQQALSMAEKLQDENAIFHSITSVSGALYVLGNYTLELDFAFRAKDISERLSTPYTIGYANGLLSDCYYYLGEYQTSMQYWREVIKISEETLPDELFNIYGNASHIFTGMNEYDSALIYARKSYKLMKSKPSLNKDNDDSKWARSNLYTYLGDAFAGKAEYDSALLYYRMSIPFSDDIQMLLNKVDAYNGIADVYKEKNNADSAIWYAKKALDEKIANTYPLGKLKTTTLLAAMYELKNNTDSSLKYLHATLSIKDSLFNKEKAIAFQNIIFKEKEKQKDIETATQKLKRQYTTYLLITLSVISLISAGIIIRNRRIKQLQNIRNHIADDLHDDIGSTLSSISIMSELAKAQSPEARPLLNSISENTAAIQENMSDIIWAVNPQNDRFENVLLRMNLFAVEILEAKNIQLEFNSDASLATYRLTMKQRKNLYLFFKEAINNSAKYSKAEKVFVRITKKDRHIEMNIADNGIGFDATGVFNGNGMNTFKKRAEELNAEFKITSPVNKGTNVQLRFKIT
jgi:signal transduction histidine kinase